MFTCLFYLTINKITAINYSIMMFFYYYCKFYEILNFTANYIN